MSEVTNLHTNKTGFPVQFPVETMKDLDAISAIGTFNDGVYQPLGFTKIMDQIIGQYLSSGHEGPLVTHDEDTETIQRAVRLSDQHLATMEERFPGMQRYSLVAGVALTATLHYSHTCIDYGEKPPKIHTISLGQEPGSFAELLRHKPFLGFKPQDIKE